MKGLLIKDIKFILREKTLIVLMFFVTGCMLFQNDSNYSFVLMYFTFIMSFLPFNSLSNDENEHGYSFLFSLPISKEQYVGSKYIINLLCMLVGLVISSTAVTVTRLARNDSIKWESWILTIIFTAVVISIMTSILLPLQIKFGASKSRLILLLVVAVFFLLVYSVSKSSSGEYGYTQVEFVNNAVEKINNLPSMVIAGVGILLAVLITYVTSKVSIGVLNKKDI